ncbi:hypothetical protein CDAR_603421 [Caerostris darwini]|uniref:Neurotransmitter-gated ion-channel ligand-binding domain-containing protein n=1 Tax=Caerostris darwini TaxID=1538125 RepID=A0AAV4SN70_9ARAC|nr:hypothetical protein CDAR_603421 [Caerostris darwini]
MAVYEIDEINEASMDFRLHGYLRTDWIDERITVNSSLVNNRCIDYLWVPDVIFEHSKVTRTFGRVNSYFSIGTDKRLRSAERLEFYHFKTINKK